MDLCRRQLQTTRGELAGGEEGHSSHQELLRGKTAELESQQKDRLAALEANQKESFAKIEAEMGKAFEPCRPSRRPTAGIESELRVPPGQLGSAALGAG